MTAYMRWLAAERDLDFRRRATSASGSGPSLTSRPSGARSGTTSTSIADGDPEPALASADMPGAEWFPNTRLNYAEHIFRDKDPAALAIQHLAEGGTLGQITWGELSERVAAFAAGLRSLGVAKRRSRRRLPPERPRGARRLPRLSVHRRDLVVVLTRLRRPLGHRPLRPDRAQGPPRRRRLHLRRQALRPHGRRPRASRPRCRRSPTPFSSPTSTRTPTPPRLAHGIAWDRRSRQGRRRTARVRARAVRPPPLGPLLLGHDRPPQGHRPGTRRHPPRAPEEDAPPRRRAGRATASSGSPRPAG